jgi:hypothetical protein
LLDRLHQPAKNLHRGIPGSRTSVWRHKITFKKSVRGAGEPAGDARAGHIDLAQLVFIDETAANTRPEPHQMPLASLRCPCARRRNAQFLACADESAGSRAA